MQDHPVLTDLTPDGHDMGVVAFDVDGTRCGLHVRNHVAVPTDGSGATTTLSMRRDTLTRLLAGIDTFSALVASGDVRVDGDARAVDTFRVCLENKGMSS